MKGDLVEWAERLAPRVEAWASEIDAQRKLPESLLEELFAQDIFRALVPRAMGGQERELPEFVATVEVLARADASTAWCVNQGGVFASTSAWFDPEGAAEIWADEHCAIGNGPPPLGAATPVDGGFEVTGRWSFSSGCDHASWLSGIARVKDAEARMFYFPRAEVNFHDTWNVRGLRGTGSYDISVEARFVPIRRSVVVPTGPVPGELSPAPGPLFAIPIVLLFACGFAAVAVGVARGALDDAIILARSKTARFNRTALNADPHVLDQVGRAETLLLAARQLLFATVADVWSAVVAAGQISQEQRILLRMAATHCIRESARVVDIAYNIAGTNAIHHDQSLQRRFQDMHVITQHVQARTAFYPVLGTFFLNGEWPDSPYI
jgi:alkylation response protein AidB-like acyl-CoA dehydrogenase